MTFACTVHALGSNDAEAWALLRREALDNHPLAFGASVPDDPNLLVEFIRPRLDTREESAVFGAFIGGSLAGIVGIVRHEGLKERHKALLWGMYVTPRRRGSGAGEALLRAAIDHARAWPGVQQVHLSVSSLSPNARRLYERNGFKEWGREPHSLCWKGEFADETHMVLNFSST